MMAIFYPLLIYIFVTTFTPGPNNIMAMSHGVQSGYKSTLGFMFGVFSGMAIILLLCGFLNVVIVNSLPQFQFWLNLAGAGYMAYLGIHTVLSKAAVDSETKNGTNTFGAGLVLQFLNLKVILYGITVYSLYITRLFIQPYSITLSALLMAGVGFVATSCWALGGSIFRSYWQEHYRVFNWVMGGSLVYLAIHSLVG
jgi:cysteine/O-acetylserine efflux protein